MWKEKSQCQCSSEKLSKYGAVTVDGRTYCLQCRSVVPRGEELQFCTCSLHDLAAAGTSETGKGDPVCYNCGRPLSLTAKQRYESQRPDSMTRDAGNPMPGWPDAWRSIGLPTSTKGANTASDADVLCPTCQQWTRVSCFDPGWTCRCGETNAIGRCTNCHLVSAARLAKGRLDRELKWFVCALCGTRSETSHAHSLTPEAPIEEYARTLSFLHVTHQDGRAKLLSGNTLLAAPDANPAPGSALTILRDSEGVTFLSGSIEASALAGLRLGSDSLLDIEIGGPEFRPMESVKGLTANAALINQSMVSALFALAAPGPKPPLSIISLETTAGFFVLGREETQEYAQVALTPVIGDVRGAKARAREAEGPLSGSFEPTEALTKLAELHDRGLISDEELAAARAKIIERLTS